MVLSVTLTRYLLLLNHTFLTPLNLQSKCVSQSSQTTNSFLNRKILITDSESTRCLTSNIAQISAMSHIPNVTNLHFNRYRRSINTQVEGNVLQLISLLAKATKDNFHTSICDCIDGMLWMTLTKALTDCLAVLHANVPAVKNKIQGK